MKRILLTLVVSFALCGTIFAQHPETHWPEFSINPYAFYDQIICFAQIDGEFITLDDDWENYEIAAFVGDEIRGTAFMDDYTEDGDPYPSFEFYIRYNGSGGEEVNFKLYNHTTGTLYEDGEINVEYTTGSENHLEIIFADYDNAVVFSFTTPASEAVPTVMEGGYWNDETTWENGEVPENVDVIINGEVIIPGDIVAHANSITINEGGSLTIEEGGQLYHSNVVPVSMTMSIDGYSSKANPDGYYMIAPPVYTNEEPYAIPVGETMLNTDPFDLYYFDGSQEELEWRNFKFADNAFTDLFLAEGYLYANQSGIDITWNGNTYPTTDDMDVDLAYAEEPIFASWNLIGNPYTCNAYIDKPYYVLEGNVFTSKEAGVAIAPMKGIFVQATEEGTTTFTTNEPSKRRSSLNITLRQNGSLVDNAIISFSNGSVLEKFQLNPNNTKIYMPVDGKDYAIVSAESNIGEMPVSFKAEKNGTYTLSFTNEEVTFSYLHLIDNLTGNEVNLLETPSYTFDAKTTDYESRFKLVFATGNANDDNFAFFSNGSFVINNEGNATLQVIDVTGRMISSETINGCANVNVNAAQGVYMLRLVNGDNVKVQKVVVR